MTTDEAVALLSFSLTTELRRTTVSAIAGEVLCQVMNFWNLMACFFVTPRVYGGKISPVRRKYQSVTQVRD